MERGAAQDTITSIGQATPDGGFDAREAPPTAERATAGLEFPRFFTREGADPFDEIDWELRAAVIGNERGRFRLVDTRRRTPGIDSGDGFFAAVIRPS